MATGQKLCTSSGIQRMGLCMLYYDEGAFGDLGCFSAQRKAVAGELFYKIGTATDRAATELRKDLLDALEGNRGAVLPVKTSTSVIQLSSRG